MNLPNKLTVLRIIMIPICLGLWALGQPVLSAAVFALAAITDFLDGYIARKQKIVTVFGKFADPVADKVLVLTAMIFLCADGRLPAWAARISNSPVSCGIRENPMSTAATNTLTF